ncbi:MAG TPA: PAS domain S-box protein [Ktedonobacteraceae bacterium]
MSTTIQSTLLDLMQQVIEDPDHIPILPLDVWPEGSEQQHLLTGFRDMLERLQQHYQDKLETQERFSLAEEQLREKEEQYRSIFEASSDGLYIIDLDGFVVEANPAAHRQLSYTYEELIGMHRSTFLHSDYRSLVPEYLQVIQAGDQFQGRAVDVRKDGTLFPVEVRGKAFTFKGQPHTLSVVRDITRQVEAEQLLREREEQYRSIFEATNDGLFITDLEDGHLVEVNPAACRMHGYSYEEFIALHPTAFIHPNSHHLFAEYLQTVRAGGQFHARADDIRKDGTTFPVEVYGTTFIYKGMSHVLGIVRDITKQVQAEELLREKEEQYRSIFEATTDGLVILDPDGFYVEANPANCRMFGYTREELIGLHASALTAPESLHLVTESTKSVKEGREIQTEGLALRKDGSVFHAEAHLTPFIYQGKPHMLGVTRDITERVEAEKQLREKEEQYRSVFEATYDALFIMDLDGFIVEVNPAFCSMFDYH